MAEHECIQERSITTLELQVKNLCDTMEKNNIKTQAFIDKFYEKDKPIIDESRTFMNVFNKILWIVLTPLIAGIGLGIIVVGWNYMQNGGK